MVTIYPNVNPTTKNKYTIVLKLGSSSLVDADTKDLKLSTMSRVVETVIQLKRQGHRVVIVSSGGIAMGLNVMKLDAKPKNLSEIQAIAAIGQSKLIGKWDTIFEEYNQEIAQILLTRNDILNYTQFNNAKNTITELMDMNIIPIVNENDTLSTSEIEFGDNDTLSGVTASLIHADYLFLLTDVDSLYSNDPRIDPNAKPIITINKLNLNSSMTQDKEKSVHDSDDINFNVSNGSGTSVGTGGMKTKLIAADIATKMGVTTIIMNSEKPYGIEKILNYMDNHFNKAKKKLNNKDSNSESTSDDSDNDIYSMKISNRKKNSLKANKIELDLIKKLNVPLHTKFIANDPGKRLGCRQFWLLHGIVTKGSIIINEKAYEHLNKIYNSDSDNGSNSDSYQQNNINIPLSNNNSSDSESIDVDMENIKIKNENEVLEGLDVNDIIGVEDTFHENECVDVKIGKTLANGEIDPNYPLKTVGRAMVNYTSNEIDKIKGLQKDEEIENILGYNKLPILQNKGSSNKNDAIRDIDKHYTYKQNSSSMNMKKNYDSSHIHKKAIVNNQQNQNQHIVQADKDTNELSNTNSCLSLVASKDNLALTPL